jgi:hypothetical protein
VNGCQLLVSARAHALKGHINVEERGMKIDSVTTQIASTKQAKRSSFVKTKQARPHSIYNFITALKAHTSLVNYQQQKTIVLYIQIPQGIILNAANGNNSADIIFEINCFCLHALPPVLSLQNTFLL